MVKDLAARLQEKILSANSDTLARPARETLLCELGRAVDPLEKTLMVDAGEDYVISQFYLG